MRLFSTVVAAAETVRGRCFVVSLDKPAIEQAALNVRDSIRSEDRRMPQEHLLPRATGLTLPDASLGPYADESSRRTLCCLMIQAQSQACAEKRGRKEEEEEREREKFEGGRKFASQLHIQNDHQHGPRATFV